MMNKKDADVILGLEVLRAEIRQLSSNLIEVNRSFDTLANCISISHADAHSPESNTSVPIDLSFEPHELFKSQAGTGADDTAMRDVLCKRIVGLERIEKGLRELYQRRAEFLREINLFMNSDEGGLELDRRFTILLPSGDLLIYERPPGVNPEEPLSFTSNRVQVLKKNDEFAIL